MGVRQANLNENLMGAEGLRWVVKDTGRVKKASNQGDNTEEKAN